MKKKVIASFVALGLMMSVSGSALAACTAPDEPLIPEGDAASGSDMIKAKKAVEDFMAAIEEYIECSRPNSSRENRLVDQVNDVADRFNVAVRAYKAKA